MFEENSAIDSHGEVWFLNKISFIFTDMLPIMFNGRKPFASGHWERLKGKHGVQDTIESLISNL